jgi:chromosome segregation ATPase
MTAKKDDLEKQMIEDLLEDGESATGATLRLTKSEISKVPSLDTSVKTSLSRIAVKSGVGLHRPTEAHLIQSENLRIAQQKILDLENETERLRRENEKLAAAGETIRQRSEQLDSDCEQKERKILELKDQFAQEKEIESGTSKEKDRELKELRIKIQDFENRLSSNLQKIRVRERELENRLELVRMESSAVHRSKDDMLLDLKRQIDQLNIELENYRKKTQELNKQGKDHQELVRRTVKALRLALSMLEGEETKIKGTGS